MNPFMGAGLLAVAVVAALAGSSDDDPEDSSAPDGSSGVWECVKCERVHARNPTECDECGFTIFDWHRGPAYPCRDQSTGLRYAVSEEIVKRIAVRECVDPADLDPPLYEFVDPDALDMLIEDATGGAVSFSYYGYEITVKSDGTVLIEDR